MKARHKLPSFRITMQPVFLHVLVVFLGVLVLVLLRYQVPPICAHENDCNNLYIQEAYDIESIHAPTADGSFLSILSLLLARSFLGPFLRRSLLNDNNLVRLRELASQIDLPPLHFPVVRRGVEEDMHREKQNMNPNDLIRKLSEKILERSNTEATWTRHRTVRDYADAYRSGRTKPSTVMKKLIAQVRSWEQSNDFHVFSYLNESSVLSAAYSSDERYAKGSPLGIMDGVPVAIKVAFGVRASLFHFYWYLQIDFGKNPFRTCYLSQDTKSTSAKIQVTLLVL